MKISVNRDDILKPLTTVAGAVERRQTMPILSNLLVKASGESITVTGTDLEVELTAKINCQVETEGQITIPARKLLDICKSLPDGAAINIAVDDAKVLLQSGSSRFSLSTLPAADFPAVLREESTFVVKVNQKQFSQLIGRTAFSMAQQDVRYYLNGMLWELNGQDLKVVATDGHRLAVDEIELVEAVDTETKQVIVPRKGVLELARLMADVDSEIHIQFSANHILAETDDLIFVSKLVDGKFPDYQRVLPKNGDKIVLADKNTLRSALTRAAILSNEKFRGVRFTLSENTVSIQANNPEQEEASEQLAVDYSGGGLEMGFNVSYLIDVLGVIGSETVKLTLSDSNSSALIEDSSDDVNSMYVIMPMRL